jgi:hypothetical protein
MEYPSTSLLLVMSLIKDVAKCKIPVNMDEMDEMDEIQWMKSSKNSQGG